MTEGWTGRIQKFIFVNRLSRLASPALMRAMKMLRRLGLPLALFATSAFAQTTPTPYDTVDPFIGTGGEGHTFPGAVAPFGMVQLSPETDTTCPIRVWYAPAPGLRSDTTHHPGFS